MANVLSLVSYQVFPAKLGGQKGIAFFYRFLSKYHNITFITVKKNDPASAPYHIDNSLSDSKLRYINVFYYFKLNRLIKKFSINVLLVEHPYLGWLGILLQRKGKLKLIVHSHNIEAERFKSVGKWWWKILWYYEKWVHTTADITFCKTAEDRRYMIEKYKVSAEKCTVITYGIEWERSPDLNSKMAAREQLINYHHLDQNVLLFLFNGTLNYPPNFQAVKNILADINPILLKTKLNYKIIICGKGLPAEDNELKAYADRNIIYAGFVDDINIYFKGADVFINPVVDGGGIKTKLVEALGNSMNAVSCRSGAIGVDEAICNNKMAIVADNDWVSFADKMQKINSNTALTGDAFFDHFYWDNIAKKAAAVIS